MVTSSEQLIPPGLTCLADNIITKDNISGTPKETEAKWAKNLNLAKDTKTYFLLDVDINMPISSR